MRTVELLQFVYEFDNSFDYSDVEIPDGYRCIGLCNGDYAIIQNLTTMDIFIQVESNRIVYLAKTEDAFFQLCELIQTYNYAAGNINELRNEILAIDNNALTQINGLWEYILKSGFSGP